MTRPLHLAVVAGTRPEVCKLAPLIRLAQARSEQFRVRLVPTGQHRESPGRSLALLQRGCLIIRCDQAACHA
jgi:UDP-N-acetylglucosamine 2-epimerase